jgi:hypothetical protein
MLTPEKIIGILTTYLIYSFVGYGILFLPVLTPILGHAAFRSHHSTLTAHFLIASSIFTNSLPLPRLHDLCYLLSQDEMHRYFMS